MEASQITLLLLVSSHGANHILGKGKGVNESYLLPNKSTCWAIQFESFSEVGKSCYTVAENEDQSLVTVSNKHPKRKHIDRKIYFIFSWNLFR